MIRQKSKSNREKGIALFLTLLFILIMSVLGVSIIFVSQSETWSGLNYLEMTQSRYGAEAGLNSASNYIVNTYCAPGNTMCTNGNPPAATDALSLYNTNVSPVTLVSSGAAVTLSTVAGASTYPVASVVSAFQSAALGSVTDGNRSVSYAATATLVAMNQVTTAAGSQTVQTWDIAGTGSTGGLRAATVIVDGVVEQQVTFASASAPSYGVFATGNACGVLSFSGGITIGSYDSKSATFSGGSLVPDKWGGDIGANGNLNESGGATVMGTYSTPRTGVGNCSSGGVDAWSDSGGATVTGCNSAPPTSPATTCGATGLVQLSQAVTYTLPAMPTMPAAGSTNLSITSTTTCTSPANLGSGCSGTAGHLTLTGTSYGNISVSGGGILTLTPTSTPSYGAITLSGGGGITLSPPSGSTSMTYNIQSLNVSGGSALNLSNTVTTTMNVATSVNLSGGQTLNLNGSSPVTLNIVGTSSSSPFTSSGGGITNINSNGAPTPGNMIINYAGSHALSLSGGTKTAAAVYAPNAQLNLSGGSNWYGSLIGSDINDSGGVSIYYDRELGSTSSSTSIATVGNFMMDSFSWTRF